MMPFPATVITASADGAHSVFGIDMDGDGDTDVLSASRYDDTVAWYENLDGSGGSFSTHVITTSADHAASVFAIDMDGDSDVDVLSTSMADDTVAWYENLDGSGDSFSTHVITSSADYPLSVFAIDMDGDGDVDVLSSSYNDDTVAWYENLDGSGGSFSTHVITTSADGPISVFAIDMDGDGDTDVLSASAYDDTVAWYENLDGSGGSFSTHVITASADGALSVLAIDMDSDGDVDVLSASQYDDKVAWFHSTLFAT